MNITGIILGAGAAIASSNSSNADRQIAAIREENAKLRAELCRIHGVRGSEEVVWQPRYPGFSVDAEGKKIVTPTAIAKSKAELIAKLILVGVIIGEIVLIIQTLR